jgi:hypothetical protein
MSTEINDKFFELSQYLHSATELVNELNDTTLNDENKVDVQYAINDLQQIINSLEKLK